LNYSVQRPNIAQNVMSGLQVGQAIKQQQSQQQQQKDMANLLNDYSPQAAVEFRAKYPQMYGNYSKILGQMDEEKKQKDIILAYRVRNAIASGNNEKAKKLFQDEHQRLKNSGQDFEAQAMEDHIYTLGEKPEATLASFDGILMEGLGLDKYLSMVGGDRGATLKDKKLMAETEKIKADTAKILTDLGLSVEKQKELPEATMKKIDKLSENIGKEKRDMSLASNLLDDLENINRNAGAVGFLQRKVSEFLGSGGQEEAWVQAFNKMSLVDMLKHKPPGALSEGELKVLQGAVPSPDSSFEVLQKYLNNAVKLGKYSTAVDSMKVKFIENNKFEGSAKQDFDIYGKKVKKGETFNKFIDRIGKDLYDEQSELVPEVPGAQAVGQPVTETNTFEVVHPDGRKWVFKTQEQMQEFKKASGL